MITEEDRVRERQDKLHDSIRLCQDILKKAEKYERLKDNDDWKGVLEDINILRDLHRREIDSAQKMMTRQSFFRKMRTVDFIVEHQIRLEQIEEALKEMDRIIAAAKIARERLPEFQTQLREQEELVHAAD